MKRIGIALATPPLPFVALIRRELLRGIRTVRLFVALLLLTAIGAMGLMGMWPRGSLPLVMIGNASYEIMMWFGALMIGAACVLIPGYAGSMILEERNQDTFDLLRTSLIRPIGILFGKFVNVIGLFVLLMLAAMPLLATTYFLVGLNTDVLIVLLFVLSLVTVTCTSIGISCSAVQKSALRAILHSYIWSAFALGGYVILVYLGVLAFAMFVDPYNLNRRAIERTLEWFVRGSPFYLAFRGFSAGVKLSDVLFVTASQSIFSLFALLVAWRRLVRPKEETAARQKSFFKLREPIRRLHPPMPTFRNPVFLREYRHTGAFREMNRWRRMLLIAIVVSTNLFLVYLFYIWKEKPTSSSEFRDVTYGWSVFVGLFVLFAAPAVQSVAFVREKEQDTLDLLKSSLLTPIEITTGKLKAGIMQLVQLLLFAYLCSFPVIGIVLMAPKGLQITFWFAVWTLLCAAGSITLGAIASMLVRRTSVAVPLSYALSVFYFAGPSVGIVFLSEVLGSSFPRRFAEDALIVVSPIASGFQFIGTIIGSGWEWSSNLRAESFYLLLLHVLVIVLFLVISVVIANRRWLGYERTS